MKIKKGDRGREVADIQMRLLKLGYSLGPTGADGVYGELTEKRIKEFQNKHQLPSNGVVNDTTWKVLVEESYELGDRLLYLHYPFLVGKDVEELQSQLRNLGFNPGPNDGIFGPETDKAAREFQKSVGLTPDGIIGLATIKALRDLSSRVNSSLVFPSRSIESDLLSHFTIAVDFGHGGKDSGATSSSGLKESEICEEVGERLGSLLKALGANVIYTRKKGEFIDIDKRAGIANQVGADILVSIHMNGSKREDAHGTETLYYAGKKSFSHEGKKLAELIQREMVKVLGSKDRGIKGRALKLLRKTKMPSVLVEPVFITNSYEAACLKEEAFRQKIAVAIQNGLKSYLLASFSSEEI